MGFGVAVPTAAPPPVAFFAHASGLTAVHVNRTIKGLEAEGLIERAHPRFITIGDWRKLAEAGDFDSNYLHLQQEEPALT